MRWRHASCPLSLTFLVISSLAAQEFRSVWPENVQRPWPGPEYWSNPLQDWRVRNGRLECWVAGGDRNVFLLTREAAARPGTLAMSVRLGRLEDDTEALGEGFVGFRFGIRGYFKDYRDSAVRGDGTNAGIFHDGRLFIGNPDYQAPRVPEPFADIMLELKAEPAAGAYLVQLEAKKPDGSSLGKVVRERTPADWVEGGLALVCHSGRLIPAAGGLIQGFGQKEGTNRGGAFRFWFRDWSVSGSKLDTHDGRAFGPILFAMHTVSRRVLKLNAQLAPVDLVGAQAALEVQEAGSWRGIASAPVDPVSRTATFRVPNWDDTRDIPYRVAFTMPDAAGTRRQYSFGGIVRKDPKSKPEIVVAAFTGNNDLGFPHADIVRNVSHFKPDLLVFTGDNIYERVGEYGIQRSPIEAATLDYLRKWYLFGWEFRDLMKDIPAVAIPDDHDVYHGNLWGAGGRHAEGEGYEGQDQGGYTMPAAWVNMVQRTQTANLPDPYDPTPVEQDITVYYTSLLYGGVSFAIIEDRKFKSPPKFLVPKAQIINGWPQNPDYNAAAEGDVPGAELLGRRQLDFLKSWAADWSGGAWMKAAISQTIFANVATLPRGANTDALTPKLRVMRRNEYPEDEAPVMDHDSNGWPQTGRNLALRAMRSAFAIHIAGDQHLGSTIQYGIDDWNDAGWAICVPSVANVWPRRWYPSQPGGSRKPGAPRHTGEFLDGFGNKMTVHAVSNPTAAGVEPAVLHDRAPGYGIIAFDRATRRISFANWPRWVDVARPGAAPYLGWPITVEQLDNGFPRSGPALPQAGDPTVKNPVLQVIDQSDNQVVYTWRMTGTTFTPRVFKPGVYTVRLFDPDGKFEKVFKDQKTMPAR